MYLLVRSVNVWNFSSSVTSSLLSPHSASFSLFLPSRDLNLTTHLLMAEPWLGPAPRPDWWWGSVWLSSVSWCVWDRWKDGRWNMLASPVSSRTGDSGPACFRDDNIERDRAKKLRIRGTRDLAPAIMGLFSNHHLSWISKQNRLAFYSA